MRLSRKFAALLLVIYVFPMAIWWFTMSYQAGYSLSYDNANWGAFGSFVGGVLSPVFSLVSIIYVIQTLQETRNQNTVMCLKIEKEERKKHLIHLSELFRSSMERRTEDLRYGLSDKVPPFKPTVRANLYYYNSEYSSLSDSDKELWFGIVGNLSCNAENAFISTLELLLESSDEKEMKHLLNLVWAAYDVNDMVELLNYNKKCLVWGNLRRSPVLDKLVELNTHVSFFESWSMKYREYFESKA
ncbi:hypothetical protein RCJ22_36790 [Vibrio sp. FNV 38]|nr:hypothetical protein [Vibrio sp. FNV 38]